MHRVLIKLITTVAIELLKNKVFSKKEKENDKKDKKK
jgi:hypothetical protein